MSAERRGGRRVAQRRAPRPGTEHGSLTAVGLLVAAALAIALVHGQPPDDPVQGTRGEPVDRTQLSCPTTSLADLSDSGVRVRAFAGLATDDATGARLGNAGAVRTGPVGDTSRLGIRRGELASLDGAADGPVVDGEGDLAAGLFGFRTDRSSTATAVGTCETPRASWWFSGVGAGLDHSSQLVLANLDPGPAVVDVRVFGSDGEVDTVGTRGITIAPGESTTLSLADVAPQAAELMVNVQATRGRVTVAASDRFAARPAGPVGFEWVGGAVRPSRAVRLAGVPASASAKTLLVGNQSESEALVQVEVAGSGGTFAPTELEGLSVAPGTVESVDLADVLPREEAVTVRLRSQVPVLGALRATTRSDETYAVMASPLVGPSAVPVLAGHRSTLQLTAGDTGAVVRLEGFDADGKSTGDEEVEVPATATATWRPQRGAAYAVVRPLEGSVFGAAVYDGDGGLSSSPLRSLPIRVRVPEVVPGPR